MDLDIDLTGLRETVNDAFWPLMTCRKRFLVLRGGAGAGKSQFCAQKLLTRRILGLQRGIRHSFLLLRKTGPAARRSVFRDMKDWIAEWELRPLVETHETDMTFHWIDGTVDYCQGVDDPEKLKSLSGITTAWMEEATEFTPDDFTQVNLRLRGRRGPHDRPLTYFQIMLSFNPISRRNWVYQHFFDPKTPAHRLQQTELHHSTYKDNRFLDDDYRGQLEAYERENENYHRVYTLGEWGELRGLIYDNWRVEDDWPGSFDIVIYGLDFGFTVETALVEIGIRDGEPWLRELVYERGMTNRELIARMGELGVNRGWEIIADEEKPEAIKEIGDAGYSVRACEKGPGSVMAGIDVCKRRTMHVHRGSVGLIKELEGYRWREKNGMPLDEPIKLNDHGLDAVRYSLHYLHDLETGGRPRIRRIT